MSAEPGRLHPIRHGMYVLPSLFTAGTIAMGYYAVLQSIRGINRQQLSLLRSCSDCHRPRRRLRWSGRPHRTPHQHIQRLRTGARLARRRHHLRRRAQSARVSLGSTPGRTLRLSDHRIPPAAHRCRNLLPLPHLRRLPPRALQHQHRPAAAKPRPAGPQVLRRHAHSRWRRRDCCSHPL